MHLATGRDSGAYAGVTTDGRRCFSGLQSFLHFVAVHKAWKGLCDTRLSCSPSIGPLEELGSSEPHELRIDGQYPSLGCDLQKLTPGF